MSDAASGNTNQVFYICKYSMYSYVGSVLYACSHICSYTIINMYNYTYNI